jgi:hypothetical protein
LGKVVIAEETGKGREGFTFYNRTVVVPKPIGVKRVIPKGPVKKGEPVRLVKQGKDYTPIRISDSGAKKARRISPNR